MAKPNGLDLIRPSFALLWSGAISAKLWAFTLLALLVVSVGIAWMTSQEELSTVGWVSLCSVLVIAIVMWKLTRALSQASTETHGAIGGWIGWGAISAFPIMIWAFATGVDTPSLLLEVNWWTDSIVFSALLAVMILFAVVSTARAIDANGLSISGIWRYWKSGIASLALGYFLINAPIYLLTDWLSELSSTAPEVDSQSFILNFLSMLLGSLTVLPSTAYTVLAYHAATET